MSRFGKEFFSNSIIPGDESKVVFVFIAEYYSIGWMYHNLFNPSPIEEHLYFQVWILWIKL